MVKKAVAKQEEKPVGLKSIDELNAALKEWGEIAHKEAVLTAACNTAVKNIKTDYQAKMTCQVDGKDVAIADRCLQLLNQITVYAEEHKEELLAHGGKTRELTHGKLSWRNVALHLVEVDPKTPHTGLVALVDGLLTKAIAWLKTLKLKGFKGIVANDVIKVTVQIDHTKLFNQWETKQITTEQLQSIGYDIEGDYDNFAAKPADVVVKSEAAPAS